MDITKRNEVIDISKKVKRTDIVNAIITGFFYALLSLMFIYFYVPGKLFDSEIEQFIRDLCGDSANYLMFVTIFVTIIIFMIFRLMNSLRKIIVVAFSSAVFSFIISEVFILFLDNPNERLGVLIVVMLSGFSMLAVVGLFLIVLFIKHVLSVKKIDN
ncbi:MAG: hypothetical protein K6G87_18075 [Butyrivibrio sp.]|uniref:hypothetical protein n=1 Tax=Butyrivibrio sp. TaxID=28121 RepID=UPI0025FF78D2|nr:hypothetical protein [Butyrivibrio sp.]MCR5773132.1 hypothetical protein [Butyrivibrio sp.]